MADAVAELAEFWPRRGPQWDALALLSWPDGRRGELLVEAKANVPELVGGKGTVCKAGKTSRRKIDPALDETRRALHAHGTADAWVGPLYQTANRLAHLHFLRRRAGRPDAWLLHLLFENDATHLSTDRQAWEGALARVEDGLGLPSEIPYVDHVFVPSLPKPADWPG